MAKSSTAAHRSSEMPKDWMTVENNGVVVIDPNVAYPHILSQVGLDPDAPDQYALEAAYQCAKLEVARVMGPSRDAVRVIHIRSDGDRKDRWSLANHRRGKGADAASKGLEARELYRQWRGVVPA